MPAKKKTKKKPAKKRSASQRAAEAKATPSAALASLSEAVERTEKALEASAARLSEARERAKNAIKMARDKRTPSAHVAGEGARHAVSDINARRLELVTRLREAREVVDATDVSDSDVLRHEALLHTALEAYEQSLGAYDRRTPQRAEARRKR